MEEDGTLIDGTEATTTYELLDVSDKNLRDAVSKNIYGSDHTFRVKALHDAIPMSSDAVRYAIDSPTNPNPTTSAPLHWKFKGRIVDVQSRPSPLKFCQNPCDITTAPPEARGLTAQFEQLHTDFIVATDARQGIKKNDEIIVSLPKGTPYKFDLQVSFCDNPSVKSYSSDNIETIIACQSLKDIDFSQIATPSSGVEIPASSGGIQYALSEGLFQHHIDFMKDLRAKIEESDPNFPNLIVTSAYRTPEKQSSIMFDVIRRSGEEEFKRLYRRQGTPILDKFMIAYRAGNVASGTFVVNEQINAGKYFSSHLRSEALDLNTNHLTDAQVSALRTAIGSLGVSNQLLEPLSSCWSETLARLPNSDGLITPGQENCDREHIHLKIPSKYLKSIT